MYEHILWKDKGVNAYTLVYSSVTRKLVCRGAMQGSLLQLRTDPTERPGTLAQSVMWEVLVSNPGGDTDYPH
jgi:hypothetical protein